MNKSTRRNCYRGLEGVAVLAILLSSQALLAADGYTPFDGPQTTWHQRFDRFDFTMDDTTGAIKCLLERHKMKVLYAESGAEGIEQLKAHAGEIDVVLMDVMMPEMDGYEAMRRIRAMNEYKSLPIIALTAKAMKGDREKCMEAGASDYITKPIDAQQLVSLLRVWLYR